MVITTLLLNLLINDKIQLYYIICPIEKNNRLKTILRFNKEFHNLL